MPSIKQLPPLSNTIGLELAVQTGTGAAKASMAELAGIADLGNNSPMMVVPAGTSLLQLGRLANGSLENEVIYIKNQAAAAPAIAIQIKDGLCPVGSPFYDVPFTFTYVLHNAVATGRVNNSLSIDVILNGVSLPFYNHYQTWHTGALSGGVAGALSLSFTVYPALGMVLVR